MILANQKENNEKKRKRDEVADQELFGEADGVSDVFFFWCFHLLRGVLFQYSSSLMIIIMSFAQKYKWKKLSRCTVVMSRNNFLRRVWIFLTGINPFHVIH